MTDYEDGAASTTLDARALETLPGAPSGGVTLVLRSPAERIVVDLDTSRALRVGRGSACDVRIDDPSLSRQHARFARARHGVRVEDLGSRNGVLVRGERVTSATLQTGDLVSLGHVTVSVHVFTPPCRSSEPPASEPAATTWSDAAMVEVRRMIDKVAVTPLPVLVLGETGSGKELVVRAIHQSSPRSKAPFRVVNCAAIPATLIESTLFGHERGAFTGADKGQPGVFEQAEGGTVFLDEIGELSLPAQAALLRVIETGVFSRVGGSRETDVNVRIVAATHRDLDAMVRNGTFRLDLLHRLDTVTVRVPPLRDRPAALEPLIEHFLAGASRTWAKTMKRIEPDAMALLRGYHWPGNVRELRNAVERAVAISDSDWIGVADLPERVLAARPAAGRGAASCDGAALKDRHAQEERDLVIRALDGSDGDVRAAALRLGWSLRTLQRRMQQHGIGKTKR